MDNDYKWIGDTFFGAQTKIIMERNSLWRKMMVMNLNLIFRFFK